MPGSRTRVAQGSRPSRRDFVNGLLIGAPAHGFGRSGAPAALARDATGDGCDGDIGLDPRALRGGNLPSSFNVAHWLRDGRLRFEPGAVTLAPGCDSGGGRVPILDDGETFDVIIVGAGLSGLTAAFCLLRERPETRILLLDANGRVGGNAARDDAAPLPVMASTAGSYCVAPYTDFQKDLYRELGIEWEQFKIKAPLYSYFFDADTPGIVPGFSGWNIDTYGDGLKSIPYSKTIVEDLFRCRADFRRWSRTEGAPTDPPDLSNPRFDYLAAMTLDSYLTGVLRCDPIVSDFYSRYTIDALGGTAADVNAHSAISFLGAEYADLFAFPGGTAELALRLMSRLTQPRGTETAVAIRLGAVALRVDENGLGSKFGAGVTYFADNGFRRAKGRAIILACQSHVARHLVAPLSDSRRREAWQDLNTVPVVVANVAVRSAAPFVELGLGYNQYWWGSRYWADFVIADWTTPDRVSADRPTVLTFLGGNMAPPEGLAGTKAPAFDALCRL